VAHRRIGRSEERGFFADKPKQPEPRENSAPRASPRIQLTTRRRVVILRSIATKDLK